MLLATDAYAQTGTQSGSGSARSAVTVRGVAYDSLHARPLKGAFISIDGQSRSTVSNDEGAFAFDGLAPGRYVFAMQHDALDSLGLSGVTARVNVTDGRETVVLAVPSFPRLWSTMCGARPVPRDSGFVYGTIRDARSGKPVADASVDVTWTDLARSVQNGVPSVNQRRWRTLGRSDAAGDFAVCGLPRDEIVRIRALSDSSATDLIDLPTNGSRVQRRDLLLAAEKDSLSRGVVAGFLSDSNGRPLASVRVTVEGVPEARSGINGRFVLPGVPGGTRQVEFTAIGMMPVTTIADVRSGDTVRIAAMMRKVTTLDVVKVTGTAIQQRRLLALEERKRSGFGYQLDSTKISRNATMASIFAGMPGVDVARRGSGSRFNILLPGRMAGKCAAYIVLDGVPRYDQEDLGFLRAADIASIEVFPRVYSVPSELMPPRDINCGVVAIWTKEAFR